jgi:hypothetical protein
MNLGSAVALAGGTLILQVIAAQSADSISFLDTRDLVVVMTPHENKLTVGIDVLSAGDETITLRLIEVGDSNGRPVSSASLVPVSPAPQIKGKGQIATFLLEIKRPPQPGTYSGQVVAYTGEGVLIRRTFRLVVEQNATVPARVVPDFLEQIPMNGVNWGFSPVHFGPFQVGPFTLGNISVDPVPLPSGYPPDGTVLGSVAGNGGIGWVAKAEAGMTVEGLRQAGEYTGKIDLRPGASGGQSKLTVRIRDVIIWPLILLGLGLGASLIVDRYLTKSRPMMRLKVGIRELEEKALQKQDEEAKVRGSKYAGEPFRSAIYRIYKQGSEEEGLLAKAASNLLDKFEQAESDEERKKWGPGGDELERLSEYLDKLEKMYTTSRTIADDYLAMHAAVGENFKVLPVAVATSDTLSHDVIPDETKFAELQDELSSASGFMSAFAILHVRIQDLLEKHPGNAQLEAKRRELLSPATRNADRVTSLAKEVEQVASTLGTAKVRVFGAEEYINLRSNRFQGLLERGDLDESLLSVLNIAATPDHFSPVRSQRPATSDDLKKKLTADDRGFQIFTIIVALLTGLWSLYFPNATFGSSVVDYLGIFLWGIGIDQTLKLVRRLGPGLVQKVLA